MYNVHMEYECGCFKKSDYTGEKQFENQQDAYNYANIVTELMNEEFCTQHVFVAQKVAGDDFVIRVTDNPNFGGSCSTGSCGPCGCD